MSSCQLPKFVWVIKCFLSSLMEMKLHCNRACCGYINTSIGTLYAVSLLFNVGGLYLLNEDNLHHGLRCTIWWRWNLTWKWSTMLVLFSWWRKFHEISHFLVKLAIVCTGLIAIYFMILNKKKIDNKFCLSYIRVVHVVNLILFFLRYIFFADKVEIQDITKKTCFFVLIGPKSNQVSDFTDFIWVKTNFQFSM